MKEVPKQYEVKGTEKRPVVSVPGLKPGDKIWIVRDKPIEETPATSFNARLDSNREQIKKLAFDALANLYEGRVPPTAQEYKLPSENIIPLRIEHKVFDLVGAQYNREDAIVLRLYITHMVDKVCIERDVASLGEQKKRNGFR